ncbi:neutral amino acid permease [Favolaschia claudopus]|uniref:Neutral amino acid permease n=1 Tax=Favolaschia claudopus TaxID=2862362 RepID=A0AAW0D5K2_9AGAR
MTIDELKKIEDQTSSQDGEDVVEYKPDKEDSEEVAVSSIYSVGAQIAQERDHPIRYRSCSWQKTTALLMSEYICLAILSFPHNGISTFSILGMAPAVIVTIAVAASVQYTSYILWRFCLKHPEVRDVCDIGRIIFGGSDRGYNFTAVMFILNNTFIQGFHCLVGAKLLNTLTNASQCTILFSFISALICFLVSLPRTLNFLGGLGTFSALMMSVAILLALVFSGIQLHPEGFTPDLGDAIVRAWPVPGTSFVLGMGAFLNITFTFVGQITLPSIIAEMKEPRQFLKPLTLSTIAGTVVYTLTGAIMYHFVGNQYMTAPALASLLPLYKKITFCFAIPTIFYLGALYCSVTTRFIFFRIYAHSKHRYTNTLQAWFTWGGIMAISWTLAFLIAEMIPFFSDMLSLMSALFDGWFGFIYWALCYLILYPPSERWKGYQRSAETVLNYFLVAVGSFMTVAGTYVSIQSIINSYKTSTVGGVFSCVSNGV